MSVVIYEADVGSNLPDLHDEPALQHEQKILLHLSCRHQQDGPGTTGGPPREIHSLPNSLETFIATHSTD